MKKSINMIVVLLSFALLLVGCTQNEEAEKPNGQQYFNAVVLSLNDDVVSAECIENFSGSLEAGVEFTFSIADVNNTPNLVVGDNIRIVYNENNIEQGDPIRLKTVFGVFLLDDEHNPISN